METKDARSFGTLYEIATAINSNLDPRSVLRTALQSTARGLGAKACSIMLLSEDGKELRHRADHGLSYWYLAKGPVSADLSMAGALEGRSVAVLDAGNDPKVQYGQEAIREGIASMLSVPVKLRDQVVGVLRVYTAERREFRSDEMEFAEAVASLAALALENAQRHEAMKGSFELLSRRVLAMPAESKRSD